MCAAGVEPNVITCNTVLSACQRAKLPHELLAIFGAMASLGVQPDAWGYSAAINAFTQTGRMKQALELFHSMPREVPPSHHCFSAAMGACRAGGTGTRQADDVDDMLQELREEP